MTFLSVVVGTGRMCPPIRSRGDSDRSSTFTAHSRYGPNRREQRLPGALRFLPDVSSGSGRTFVARLDWEFAPADPPASPDSASRLSRRCGQVRRDGRRGAADHAVVLRKPLDGGPRGLGAWSSRASSERDVRRVQRSVHSAATPDSITTTLRNSSRQLRAIEHNRWLSAALGKNGRQFSAITTTGRSSNGKYLDLLQRPFARLAHRRSSRCPAGSNGGESGCPAPRRGGRCGFLRAPPCACEPLRRRTLPMQSGASARNHRGAFGGRDGTTTVPGIRARGGIVPSAWRAMTNHPAGGSPGAGDAWIRRCHRPRSARHSARAPRRRICASEIFVETADRRLEPLTRDYREARGRQPSGQPPASPFFDRIEGLPDGVCTPRSDGAHLPQHHAAGVLRRPPPTLARQCFRGRRELQAYVDRCEIALGDSEFNRQDLDALGFPRTAVLPVVPGFPHLDQRPNPSSPTSSTTSGRTSCLSAASSPTRRSRT